MAWYGILMIATIACMVLFFCAIAIADYVIRKHTDDEVASGMARIKASRLSGFEQMTYEEQKELIKLICKIYKKETLGS